MFSFLSPISLWFAAALSIPLLIHFMGRERLRKALFPSLLLIQESMSRSMSRHRLKNLLLLILRTLFILCLFLALFHPILKRSGFFFSENPRVSLLVHNGIYAGIRTEGRSLAEIQETQIRLIDSLVQGDLEVTPVIPSDGTEQKFERYGDYADGVRRVLQSLASQKSGTKQAVLPVFRWDEINGVSSLIRRAIESDPSLRVTLIDYSELAWKATTMRATQLQAPGQSPLFAIDVLPHSQREGFRPPFEVKAYLGDNLVYEQLYERYQGSFPVSLQGGSGEKALSGLIELSNREDHFALQRFYFSFPRPGRIEIQHVGESIVSYGSLGTNTYYRKRIRVQETREISTQLKQDSKFARMICLANVNISDAGFFAELRDFIRNGGSLVLILGPNVDVQAVNRYLFQPTAFGRLGQVIEKPGEVSARQSSWQELPGIPESIEVDAYVKTLFNFAPGDSFQTLLEHPSGPVLGWARYGKGTLLAWMTNLDDLEWTSLGLQPITPLTHLSFQTQMIQAGWTNFSIASDSVLVLKTTDFTSPIRVWNPKQERVPVRAGEGDHFEVGPFSKTGIHTIVSLQDTTRFAVNLFMPQEDSVSFRDFKKSMGTSLDRIQTLDAKNSSVEIRQSYASLWEILFLAAILLIFAECILSRSLGIQSTHRPRGT